MAVESERFEQFKAAFENQSLFEDKTWRIGVEAWPLTPKQLKEVEQIGQACLEFYLAQERLYRRSWQGRNILRNGNQEVPWVAECLDRGKPEGLIQHARREGIRNSVPMVIRPDLLLTEDGFALTELDSVPGGVGLTAYLNRLYGQDAAEVIGANDEMVRDFYETLAELKHDVDAPLVAIVVSDEAFTYRPEFEWLSEECRKLGKPVYCVHPDQLMPLGDTLCIPVDGNPEKIDILYRFFELFDLRQVSATDAILEAIEKDDLVCTPPMKHFQEEKMSLALFHHPRLEQYWKENISRHSFKVLKRIIPKSWIMDPVELPYNGVLNAPLVNSQPIYDWKQLADASQKERDLIMKISGFHETAWGARSVVYGRDVSKDEWEEAIDDALEMSNHTLHVLQEYKKPLRTSHPVYSEEGEIYPMQGRLRLCPYYYVHETSAELKGALATFCPADKKIIHGMRDAALMPVIIKQQ